MKGFRIKRSDRPRPLGCHNPAEAASINAMGVLKGRSAIRLFNKFPYVRKKLWGNSFLARGYFVDTVGIN